MQANEILRNKVCSIFFFCSRLYLNLFCFIWFWGEEGSVKKINPLLFCEFFFFCLKRPVKARIQNWNWRIISCAIIQYHKKSCVFFFCLTFGSVKTKKNLQRLEFWNFNCTYTCYNEKDTYFVKLCLRSTLFVKFLLFLVSTFWSPCTLCWVYFFFFSTSLWLKRHHGKFLYFFFVNIFVI